MVCSLYLWIRFCFVIFILKYLALICSLIARLNTFESYISYLYLYFCLSNLLFLAVDLRIPLILLICNVLIWRKLTHYLSSLANIFTNFCTFSLFIVLFPAGVIKFYLFMYLYVLSVFSFIASLHAETFLKTQTVSFPGFYFVLRCLIYWNWGGLSLVIMVATKQPLLNPHSLASALGTLPGGSALLVLHRADHQGADHHIHGACGHLGACSPCSH